MSDHRFQDTHAACNRRAQVLIVGGRSPGGLTQINPANDMRNTVTSAISSDDGKASVKSALNFPGHFQSPSSATVTVGRGGAMELDGFKPYRGYFYRVSANFSQDGQWRGTIDVLRRRSSGTTETVISEMNVPGTFISEALALDASDAYCHMLIDEENFRDE